LDIFATFPGKPFAKALLVPTYLKDELLLSLILPSELGLGIAIIICQVVDSEQGQTGAA